MVADLLVERIIDSGLKMIRLLKSNGFDVAAACMIRQAESGRWNLHIVSKIVEEKGPLESYRELVRLIGSSFPPTTTKFEVTLLNENKPLAKKILEWVEDDPGRLFTLSDSSEFWLMDIDEIYPYPQKEVVEPWKRLSVKVTYLRQEKTNHWITLAEIGGMQQGFTISGPISYTALKRNGDVEGEEPLAIVTVIVEINPELEKTQSLNNPAVRRIIIDQAQTMADQFFRSRHPNAEIEHEGDQISELSQAGSSVGTD